MRKATLVVGALVWVACGQEAPSEDAGVQPTSCSDAAGCASGHCVDGVCCDVACEGACVACARAKTGGPDGLCAPVTAGTDPDAECEAAPGSCQAGTCDGVGACGRLAAGEVCRSASGSCDVEERCVNDACPADALAASSVVCRAAQGACDVAESCSGSSAACPADVRAPATTSCRAAAGPCDVADFCDGVGATCPLDARASATVVCRAATDVCDADETCDGISAACPLDAFAANSTACRPARGPCDLEERCSGTSSMCPVDVRAPSTQTCRAPAGACDVAESCSGLDDACPADALLDSATVCRASLGVCDPEERCTGSAATCPADAKSSGTCRAAAGTCDAAEQCNGISDICPGDGFQPSSAEVCGPYRCTGTSATCTSGACASDSACTRGAFCRGGVCVMGKRVFVTSTAVAGNFGGLAAADALCAARATAANLPGTFKAWLSTSTVSASSRLTHATVPYYRRSGSTVVRLAQNWTELTSNTMGVPGPITFDESGATVAARVWTATSVSGASSPPSCADWSSTTVSTGGRQGSTQAQDLGWWTDEGTAACSNTNRLYCFEQ